MRRRDYGVDELNTQLKPRWGAEQWIAEGWEQLTVAEKDLITKRMDALFKNGLPFELKHPKLLYIYVFSLLAQLEVLAIQVPLNFEKKMSTEIFQKLMRTQLLDEIFHGMVFTKIVYLLCEPYAFPPAYNTSVEVLCNFIRQEPCPKVAVVLLNLISEGWIEELFECLQRHDIAPLVFETILQDEHRHVCEADLYRDIGLPDMNIVLPKLAFMEEHLLTNVFFQYPYVAALHTLIGEQGLRDYVESLDKKHTQQLAKINSLPGKKWQLFMQMHEDVFRQGMHYKPNFKEVEMTPLRKLLMTQWREPGDPTMVAQFNLDVTCLDSFNKTYPSESATVLMLQTVSQLIAEHKNFRSFIFYKKIYQSDDSLVTLVVKLPGCGDHLGNIVFKNCHQLSAIALMTRIKQMVRLMIFCYKKRQKLELEYPYLKQLQDSALNDCLDTIYPYPLLENPMISLTNIGACGYSQAKSPLRINETLKITLLTIEKRQIWNQTNKTFEIVDQLPVSISADHRVFDGNVPLPHLMKALFQTIFNRMKDNEGDVIKPPVQDLLTIKKIEKLLRNDMNLGYLALNSIQTIAFA